MEMQPSLSTEITACTHCPWRAEGQWQRQGMWLWSSWGALGRRFWDGGFGKEVLEMRFWEGGFGRKFGKEVWKGGLGRKFWEGGLGRRFWEGGLGRKVLGRKVLEGRFWKEVLGRETLQSQHVHGASAFRDERAINHLELRQLIKSQELTKACP